VSTKAYLLGVEAGLLSPTGRLGAVVSMDIPILKRFYVPIGQGAAAVKPGATMTPVFLAGGSQFADPPAAEGAAKQLGASHVMALAFIAVAGGLKAIASNSGGTPKSYGLKEKGISLVSLEPDAAQSQCTVVGRQDVVGKVEEVREKIISGELRVEDPAVR
jgi:basic membrane protein A